MQGKVMEGTSFGHQNILVQLLVQQQKSQP